MRDFDMRCAQTRKRAIKRLTNQRSLYRHHRVVHESIWRLSDERKTWPHALQRVSLIYFFFFKLKLITFYWTFQVAAKVRNLHDYQLRLMNNAASPPSGNDVANTLKYFSQTLLGIDWSISFFFPYSYLFSRCFTLRIWLYYTTRNPTRCSWLSTLDDLQ